MGIKGRMTKNTLGLIVIYLFFIIIFKHFYIQPYVEGFIKNKIKNEVLKGIAFLEKELNSLDMVTRDYAVWDESYYYVESPNNEYIKKNYEISSLENLGLSLVVILNKKGKLLYALQKENKKFKEFIEESLLNTIIEEELYKKSFLGLLKVKDEIYMLAGEEILKSNGEGEARGIIIFGKKLRDVKLSEEIMYSLNLIENIENKKIPNYSGSIIKNNGVDIIVNKINEVYEASYPIRDIKGHLIAYLNFYVNEDVESFVLKIWQVAVVTLFTFGVFILIIFNYKSDILVTRPIKEIMNNLKDFSQKMIDMPLTKLYSRKDEIAELAKSVDELKNEIIKKQNYLLSLNETLEVKVMERTKELEIRNKEILLADTIISETIDGIMVVDSHKKVIKINKAIEKKLGHCMEDFKNGINYLFDFSDKNINDIFEYVKDNGGWSGETTVITKKGEILPILLLVTAINYLDERYFIFILSDISEIKKAEAKLRGMAYYDSLTCLPNRSFFYEKISDIINNLEKSNTSFALLLMDIDDFKMINDTLGHNIGDQLLKKVAERLKCYIKEDGYLFRLGGDEFILVFEDFNDENDIRDKANKLILSFKEPIILDNHEVTIGVSIGIAIYPKDDMTLEGLLRKADAALYEVKEKSKGGFLFFSEEIDKKNISFVEIENGLRKALADNELKLYIQPIYREIDGEFIITKGEFLLRWIRNDKIVYPPDVFIKIAENNGMIIDIGNWVMEEANKIRRKFIENNIKIDLGINISVKHLENSDFFKSIEKYLFSENNNLNCWIFEITENVLIKDLHLSTKILKEVKKSGIKIALDDFGTGYSSINYLSKLPIDYIKIDRSFTSKAGQNGFDGVLLAMISMARSLGVKTVAEGIESKEQLIILKDLGCEEFQGYLFSKPIPVEEFISNFKLFNNIKI